MTQYYKNIDKEFEKAKRNINKERFLTTLVDIYLNSSDLINQIIHSVMSMDVYFLLRLFVVFDEKKMKRGPIGCHDLEYMEMKNVIVYAGGSHIDTYEEFLAKYFKVKPQIKINQENQDR
jgi:hypothetical protein